MENAYLNIIRKGAFSDYWLKSALKHVREGKSSIAELREALKEGLRCKIQEYDELRGRFLSLADEYAEMKKEAEEALARLERGEEIESLDVRIPNV